MNTEDSAHQRPLAGYRILVTRPTHQAAAFCRMIDSAGGNAIHLPVLEIVDPHNLRPMVDKFSRLKDFDIAIFISANAVHKTIDHLTANELRLPELLMLAAVGPSTAEALERAGYRIDLVPRDTFTSEALLALDEMQFLSGKGVLIVRGEGGREVLADTLRSRGARVEYAEVYRRTLPKFDRQTLQIAFENGKLDLITISSVEGLENLIELAKHAGVRSITGNRLLVGSERMRSAAELLGFKDLLIAQNPSDGAMFKAIQTWINKCKNA